MQNKRLRSLLCIAHKHMHTNTRKHALSHTHTLMYTHNSALSYKFLVDIEYNHLLVR